MKQGSVRARPLELVRALIVRRRKVIICKAAALPGLAPSTALRTGRPGRRLLRATELVASHTFAKITYGWFFGYARIDRGMENQELQDERAESCFCACQRRPSQAR
jgi:hypothetical protein